MQSLQQQIPHRERAAMHEAILVCDAPIAPAGEGPELFKKRGCTGPVTEAQAEISSARPNCPCWLKSPPGID